MIKFELNGKHTEFKGDKDQPLLTWLREAQGIVSPKFLFQYCALCLSKQKETPCEIKSSLIIAATVAG
jgi:aerobic-type carbon monoxide dehydrogenase small subunit (CoxS/CutS family)